MLSRLALFWRCTRHVPPRQLLRRLYLEVSRRFLMSPLGQPWRVRRNQPLPLRSDLPSRLFPPRTQQVAQRDGRYVHRLLNREFDLQCPIDWSLRAYEPTTHLQRLAFHYHECLESLPFELGRDIVLDWIEQNPPWQPGYWKDCWNSYAISIRCVCWLQWLSDHRNRLDSDELSRILGSLVEQVRFLVRNLETDICGNHLIKNIKCLLWAGVCFDGKEAKRWLTTGRHLLDRELNVQLLPDGMHFELSPAYHCQVFADLLDCALVLSDSKRRELVERLQRSAQVIVDLTHPDGLISLMSDGGLHMAYLPAECLTAFEQLGGQPVEAREHFSFPDAGYYGLRTERTYLVIDCGPPCADALPAHGHGDILSFEWDVDGQRFIVDPGVYEYEPGEMRDWSRTARSHNTVTIGDRDQCEFVGSFRVGRRAKVNCSKFETGPDGILLSGSHDGLSSGKCRISHRRDFEGREDGLSIEDEVIGGTDLNVEVGFLLHPEVETSIVGTSECLLSRGNTQVRLSISPRLQIAETRWAPDFGVQVLAKRLVSIEPRFKPPLKAGFELLGETDQSK